MLAEEKLELDRNGLIERRIERLDFLRQLAASAASQPAAINGAMIQRG